MQRYVSGRTGDPLIFVMKRDGREVEFKATPETTEQKDALGNTVRVGVIGVVNNPQLGQPKVVRYSIPGAIGQGVLETGHSLERTWTFLKRFALGREDKCQLGGPVKSPTWPAERPSSASNGWFSWWPPCRSASASSTCCRSRRSTAAIWLFYGLEAVIGRPVSERAMEMVYRVGCLLVLGFMGFVFWNDLFGC